MPAILGNRIVPIELRKIVIHRVAAVLAKSASDNHPFRLRWVDLKSGRHEPGRATMLSSGEPTVHTPEAAAANADPARITPGGDEASPTFAEKPSAAKEKAARSPLLRRADQTVVAVIVAASLVAVATYWYMRGGMRGDLIEIEADVPDTPGPPLKAAYTVDLNTADWPEFEPLPNVGERLARRIVESRETDGPFESVDDIGRIRGVGAKTIERLRPYLRVSKPPTSPP